MAREEADRQRAEYRSPFAKSRARAKGLLPPHKTPKPRKPKIPKRIAETQHAIAEYLKANPRAKYGDIAEAIGIPKVIVWQHVKSAFEREGVFADNMRQELRALGGHMLNAIEMGLTMPTFAPSGQLALKALSHIGVPPRGEVTGRDGAPLFSTADEARKFIAEAAEATAKEGQGASGAGTDSHDS